MAKSSFRNPVHEALQGPQAALAEVRGVARRYPPAVTPFFSLPDSPTERDWTDAADLLGGDKGFIASADLVPPSNWRVLEELEAFVMGPNTLIGHADARVRPLEEVDIPAMQRLTQLTKPGPFGPRTIELGDYIGIERDGQLLAMGGTRFRGSGWREISAVCTAPEARGQGLASAIVLHLANLIETTELLPILLVITTNPAERLYRRLGFEVLHPIQGMLLRPPA